MGWYDWSSNYLLDQQYYIINKINKYIVQRHGNKNKKLGLLNIAANLRRMFSKAIGFARTHAEGVQRKVTPEEVKYSLYC